MFLTLWEYDVKPGFEERFVSVYGPGGDWAQLFRRDSAYQRTLLLRDPFRSHTYLTCDFWETRVAYETFLQNNSEAYLSLDIRCDKFAVAERNIGAFEQLLENA